MLITQKNTIYAFPLALLFIAYGCSDSSTGPKEPDTNFDASAILDNVANNVIVSTYINLNAEAGKLVDAVKKLNDNTTTANLKAAQKQWRNTRVNWEASEAFLYTNSPVETDGIDPKIDSWPLDKTALDGVLKSDDKLTADYVGNLKNNQKGFHTIEYLLFGTSNDKTVDNYTGRQLDYLIAATKRLKYNTNLLETSYGATGDNWISNITEPGSGKYYKTQKAVLEQLVTGMKAIADEVGNSKIGGPFSEKNPQKVESQFSFNSKIDFKNNLRSIQHIYTGDYNGNEGKGLTDYVVKQNPDLDARFKNEIKKAIDEIGNIKGNFRTAITNNRESVKNAQDAVQTVLSTLQKDITPLLGQS